MYMAVTLNDGPEHDNLRPSVELRKLQSLSSSA